MTRGWKRWLWLLVYPVLLIFFVVGAFMIPASDLAHERLPDGRVVHLSMDPILTDASYSLWVETANGLYWRRLGADLSYSEDGRFVGDERLVLSRDRRRLLISRGGIWTDCVYADVPTTPCAGTPTQPFWTDPNFEADMRRNSVLLSKLL